MKWASLIIFSFFAACNQSGIQIDDKPVGKKGIDGKGSHLIFCFNLDTSADYGYRLLNSVKMEQEINGKSFKSDTKIDAQYEFSLSKKSADTNTVRIKYSDFSISMAIDGNQVSANAKTAKYSSNPSIRVFSAFLETDFVYDLDSTGRILSASGMDDLTKRMIELGKNDQEVVQQIKSYVKGLARESLMKTSVLKAFNFLPPALLSLPFPLQISDTCWP